MATIEPDLRASLLEGGDACFVVSGCSREQLEAVLEAARDDELDPNYVDVRQLVDGSLTVVVDLKGDEELNVSFVEVVAVHLGDHVRLSAVEQDDALEPDESGPWLTGWVQLPSAALRWSRDAPRSIAGFPRIVDALLLVSGSDHLQLQVRSYGRGEAVTRAEVLDWYGEAAEEADHRPYFRLVAVSAAGVKCAWYQNGPHRARVDVWSTAVPFSELLDTFQRLLTVLDNEVLSAVGRVAPAPDLDAYDIERSLADWSPDRTGPFRRDRLVDVGPVMWLPIPLATDPSFIDAVARMVPSVALEGRVLRVGDPLEWHEYAQLRRYRDMIDNGLEAWRSYEPTRPRTRTMQLSFDRGDGQTATFTRAEDIPTEIRARASTATRSTLGETDPALASEVFERFTQGLVLAAGLRSDVTIEDDQHSELLTFTYPDGRHDLVFSTNVWYFDAASPWDGSRGHALELVDEWVRILATAIIDHRRRIGPTTLDPGADHF